MATGRVNLLILFFIFSALSGYAQENEIGERTELSPGVEVIKVGPTNIIVPKGATVTKKDGMLLIEDIGQYTGRRFEAVEERLSQIEATQEDLRKELEGLKSERILELETNQEALRADTEKIKGRLPELEARQEGFQAEAGGLAEHISQLEAGQEGLRKDAEQLKAERIAQIEINQGNLGKEIKQIREDLRKEIRQLKKRKGKERE